MPHPMSCSVPTALLAVTICSVLFVFTPDASVAQVLSTVDTMSVIVPPDLDRGEQVHVDVHIQYTDTLGAFALRLRYDPAVFEPSVDTLINGADTTFKLVATQLHPGSLESFAGFVREPGVITFLGLDINFNPGSLFLPVSWPTLWFYCNVRADARYGATTIEFENDTLYPASYNTISDWRGVDVIRPVLLGGATSVFPGPDLRLSDTMLIAPPTACGREQEIEVDIRLRTADTLGAFAYRIRYDPLVFEPLQDTLVYDNDTVISIIALDLHPGRFEQFSGSVREPGLVVFLAADMDFDSSSLYLPGSRLTVGMVWAVKPDAPLGPSAIYFEGDPLYPYTWNAFADWRANSFWRPVLVDAVATVVCYCGCLADPSLCNGIVDITDVVMTVQVAFGGSPAIPDLAPHCPISRTDVDCDGETSIIDVVKMIEVAFRNADPSTTFCNPCE